MPTSKSSLRDIIVFIPARGGSKGIPRKNLSKIQGESLLRIAVQKATRLETLLGNNVQIVISTDDEEIGTEGLNFGATQIHWRPGELARDESTLEEALHHFIASLSKDRIATNPIFAVTQCTSPFMKLQSILKGVKLINDGNFDSAFTGLKNHYWLYSGESGNEGWQPFEHPLKNRPPRQAISPKAHETGGGYFFSLTGFLNENFRLHGRIGLVEIDSIEGLDIDEQEDLDLCRMLANGPITAHR